MKTLLIIGIGAGDPDYLTVQAINALNRTDVFFLMDKGSAKDSLIGLRKTICERFIQGRDYRFVSAGCPERVRDVPDYRGSVVDLNQDKQQVFEGMIREQMSDGETAAFLVWGDPALYDSTLRIVEQIVGNSSEQIEYEVIPGITSLQALAAKHKVCFNSIGQAFQITPARRLAEGGFPPGVDSVLVMLDAQDTYQRFVDQSMHIYWGAYIGTPDEVLIAGPLAEVAETIRTRRAELREQHGWIMDSYLLRKQERASVQGVWCLAQRCRLAARRLPKGKPAVLKTLGPSAIGVFVMPKSRFVMLLATLFLLTSAGASWATEQGQQRRAAREVRQETRQDSRQTKQDCRAADQKNNPQCRQDKRQSKQQGRETARDIKY